ncbi:MAG TPA: hypothetical protein V6D08_16655 [Candidatus Obscuribacterales bacterium]
MGHFQNPDKQVKGPRNMKEVWFSPRKQSAKDLFLPHFSFNEEEVVGLRRKLALDHDYEGHGGDGVSGMGVAMSA